MAIHDLRYGDLPLKNTSHLDAIRAINHIAEDYTWITKVMDSDKTYYIIKEPEEA